MVKAKEFGFKQCYLETMPYMTAAQKLYKKNGFKTNQMLLWGTRVIIPVMFG